MTDPSSLTFEEKKALAMDLWLYGQQQDGWVQKFQNTNPFIPWPPDPNDTKKLDDFIRFAENYFSGLTESQLRNTIDPKQREELLGAYEKNYDEAKAGRLRTETLSKDHVQEIIKSAKKEAAKRNTTIEPLPAAPVSLTPEPQKVVTEEQVVKAIKYSLETSTPAESKTHFFQAVLLRTTENPARSIQEIIPEVIAAEEFITETLISPKNTTLDKALKIQTDGTIEKFLAPIGDVFNIVGKDALDKTFLKSVANIEKNSALLTQKFGADIVSQPWFDQAMKDTARLINEKSSSARGLSIFSNAASTLISYVKQPPDEEIIAYLQTYHIRYVQGLPPMSYAHFEQARHAPGFLHYGAHLLKEKGLEKVAEKATGGFFAKIGAALAAALGPLGAAAGAAVGWLGGKLAASFAGGALSAFSGDFAKNILSGESPGFWGSIFAIMAAVIVGAMVLVNSPIIALGALLGSPTFQRAHEQTAFLTSLKGAGGLGSEQEAPPPTFSQAEGSVLSCITTSKKTIEGAETVALSQARMDRVEIALAKYPQLGCLAGILGCPQTTINLSAYTFTSPEGYGAYAPSSTPGNIIFYPSFFGYSDYSLARTLAHEMMHEINWLQKDIYDAYINGSTQYPRGYCGPLGTYKWGENGSETFAEAGALYFVNPAELQRLCPASYTFMARLFGGQCKN